ncbi:MAG: trigger factor [Alphaproteobacteria bacterium]|nr:trigger factor [Alphaproteobacteria bacterium]MDE2112492.1 trigger factor [Alphaproteobacteria bacterium]MDE2494216.1 trigger factor [Alphaproteobacteria bacterium]
MQITETVSEGLRREYKVTVGAADLDARLIGKLEEIKPRLSLKGFRPGKAPVSFLKKTYGKSMMGEIVEAAVNEGSQKAVTDNALKVAFPPRVEPVGDVQQVIDGKADLEFRVLIDLMPDFELGDVSKMEVERLVADVTEADIDDAVKRLAEQSRTYTARAEGEAAQKDDAVVIDFVGSVGGEEFSGGKAENFNLVLGSSQLIPGFEDQLVGAKVGEAREVRVTFPADYPEEKLAGREALFAVTIKEVKAADPLAIDDELAKKLGLDTLGTLKERMREQLKREYASASRLHLKRRILDALDATHSFSLPPTMVEGEFNGIWRQVETELKREGKTVEDEGKSEEDLKKEYHDIAERRVRLGLVLARLGEQNGLSVGNDEIQRAISARARQFPGQEQQVFEYYARNQQALAEIRAPLFEDKVVDFIAELAQVTDKKVDRETLFLDPDEAAEKLKASE